MRRGAVDHGRHKCAVESESPSEDASKSVEATFQRSSKRCRRGRSEDGGSVQMEAEGV